MEQESFLTGGVSLLHSVVDGKHCYEVGKVLTTKPSDFGSKGDKLMMINDVETQHLPPKKFVRMLSSGSPLVTMHRASVNEGENACLETESMRPYYKETTVLYFSLDMVQETSLDQEEENPPVLEESECESSDLKDDNFTDEEILLVSMTNTSVAIVQARCCDAQTPCNSCGGTGCALSDFVVATTQSQITSGYREYILKNFERGHILIQSLLQKSITPENIPTPRKQLPHMSNSTTANITIYYYMAKADEKLGVPVVLNFSGSTNFLKCMCEKDMPVLTVECCEKSKLQRIYKDDNTTWPFVFYLTTTKDNIRRFESAAHSGWFIHTKPSGIVCVDQGSNNNESNFYVVIYLGKE